MPSELLALRLVLGRLGVRPTFSKFSQRLRAQKLVFLAQSVGVDLGYHFRQDEFGPFSRELDDDLAGLVDDMALDPSSFCGYSLPASLVARLDRVKDVVRHRSGLSQQEWLTVLSTILFTRARLVRGEAARSTLCKRVLEVLGEEGKEHLASCVKAGVTQLESAGLLPQPR